MIEGFLTCYFGINVIIMTLIILSDIKYYKHHKDKLSTFELDFFMKKLFIYLIFGIVWLLIYFWEEIL